MKISIRRITACSFGLILFILLIGINYGYGIIRVHGDSMEPSIASENVHVLNKIIYKWNEPKRFDLIVFEKDHHIYVKRIIGLPGERIEYRENQLYINGGEFSENFLTTWTNDFHLEEVTFQKRVPDNSYFVLGDNRSHSMDSRILGFIKKDQIKGKLLPMLRVTF